MILLDTLEFFAFVFLIVVAIALIAIINSFGNGGSDGDYHYSPLSKEKEETEKPYVYDPPKVYYTGDGSTLNPNNHRVETDSSGQKTIYTGTGTYRVDDNEKANPS